MSGHCEFCHVWHSGPCCHPGKGALILAGRRIAELEAQLAELKRIRNYVEGERDKAIALYNEAYKRITELEKELNKQGINHE